MTTTHLGVVPVSSLITKESGIIESVTSELEQPLLRDRSARTRKKRGRSKLTIGGVLQEFFLLTAVVGGLFVVWWLWGADFIDGLQDNEESSQIAAEWSYSSTDKTWLGGTDLPITTPSGEEMENFAVIYIPRYGMDYVRTIAEGTKTWNVLNKGWFGHYVNTAGVGDIGNFAIAGHRSSYGAPMLPVETLKVGDPIAVQSAQGWYIYRVTESYITKPTDVATIFPVPKGTGSETPTQRWMTLTTCHPIHSAAERYIVHAIFDRFIPAGQMTPEEVTTAPDTDPTVYVTTSVAEATP